VHVDASIGSHCPLTASSLELMKNTKSCLMETAYCHRKWKWSQSQDVVEKCRLGNDTCCLELIQKIHMD